MTWPFACRNPFRVSPFVFAALGAVACSSPSPTGVVSGSAFSVVADGETPISVFLAGDGRLMRLRANAGEVEWTTAVTSVAAGPVVVDDTVVAVVDDGDVVEGRDTSNGRLRWRIDESVKEWSNRHGRAMSLASDSSLVYLGMEFSVLAVDAMRGKVAWALDLKPTPDNIYPGFVSRIIPAGASIWVEGLRVDRGTGSPADAQLPPSDDCELAVAPGVVVQACSSGLIRAMDPSTLQIRWQRRLGPSGVYHVATDGRSVAVSGTNRVAASSETEFHAIAAASGHELWTRRLPTESDADRLIAFGRGIVFVSGFLRPTGEILALDCLSGKLLWRRQLPEALFDGAALAVGDWLFVNTLRTVIAYDAATGRVRWSRRYVP